MLMESDESTDVTREGRDEISLELPADSRFLGTLRGLARSLAAQCDLTVDEVEDVQMAIDEAFVLLIPYASDDESSITAEFALATGQVDIEVSLPSQSTDEPDQSGLSWTVLEALTDKVKVDAGAGRMGICFTKRRGTA
jgi:serine/threonine-protein kinase RsbW